MQAKLQGFARLTLLFHNHTIPLKQQQIKGAYNVILSANKDRGAKNSFTISRADMMMIIVI